MNGQIDNHNYNTKKTLTQTHKTHNHNDIGMTLECSREQGIDYLRGGWRITALRRRCLEFLPIGNGGNMLKPTGQSTGERARPSDTFE